MTEAGSQFGVSPHVLNPPTLHVHSIGPWTGPSPELLLPFTVRLRFYRDDIMTHVSIVYDDHETKLLQNKLLFNLWKCTHIVKNSRDSLE
jgi:hypothetical protein